MKETGMLAVVQRPKESTAQLEQKIVLPKTKEYLIRPFNAALDDVEQFLLPNARTSGVHSRMWMEAAEFRIEQAEALLKFAQE